MMEIGISPSMPLAAPRMRHAPVTTMRSPYSSIEWSSIWRFSHIDAHSALVRRISSRPR